MAWVRIHDAAMQNAKIAALSDGAFRLWVDGLCYCQVALTDGFIPATVVKRNALRAQFVPELIRSKLPGRAALWRPVRGGFRVHDYLDWNTGRDEILRKKANGAARVRKCRNALRPRYDRVTERVSNGVPSPRPSTEKYSAADAAPNVRVLERLCHEVEEADRTDWADMIEALKTQAVKHGVAFDGDALTQAVTNVAHAPGSPFAHLIRATEPLKGRRL